MDLGLGRGEGPVSSPLWIMGQRHGALEKSGGRGQATAGLGTTGRPLEIGRDLFVGPIGRESEMPCTTVGIGLGIRSRA